MAGSRVETPQRRSIYRSLPHRSSNLSVFFSAIWASSITTYSPSKAWLLAALRSFRRSHQNHNPRPTAPSVNKARKAAKKNMVNSAAATIVGNKIRYLVQPRTGNTRTVFAAKVFASPPFLDRQNVTFTCTLRSVTGTCKFKLLHSRLMPCGMLPLTFLPSLPF
jgi:hypothetical protein